MSFSLADSMQVPITASFTDAQGNPALVTTVALAISDTTVVTTDYVPNTAPVSSIAANIIATGKIGTSTLTITATNADGSTITATQDFTVMAQGATTITIVVGTPVAK